MIKTCCPHCGQNCEIEGLIGRDLITCPTCQQVFEVSNPDCRAIPPPIPVASAPTNSLAGKTCSECLSEIPMAARRCRHCGAKVKFVGRPGGDHSVTPFIAAILGLLCLTGISQMLLGQVGKGLVILLVAVVLSVLTAGVALIVIHPMVAIDAYMVAKAMQRGIRVDPWECFPS